MEIANPRRVDHQTRWVLLDRHGQRISRGKIASQDHVLLNLGHDDKSLEKCCSICLHSTSSADLATANAGALDFILLQHWTSNASKIPPGRWNLNDTNEQLRELNRVFEDTVWAMAIRSNGQGFYERLAVVSIPAKAWFTADPQLAEVRIS